MSSEQRTQWRESEANKERAAAVGQAKRQLRRSNKAACAFCAWSPPSHLSDFASHIIHIHHIVPISCGGTNEETNLVPLCPNCHAVAHRCGWRRRGKWFGATTRAKLFEDMVGSQDVAGEVAISVAQAAFLAACGVTPTPDDTPEDA